MLATAADPGVAVELLLSRQCADGTFPKHLDTMECGSGDLAATASAVTALAARPFTDAAPASKRPDGWSERRVSAVVSAVTALGVRPTGEGLVTGEAGTPDVALSASVAAARQVAGLDASGTARSLGKLARADGGFAKEPEGDGATDFPTSLAAAPGVAGRSWLTAADSPLSPALRLPLSGADAASGTQLRATAQPALPPWLMWGLTGLAGSLLLAAIVLIFLLRRFIKTKGGLVMRKLLAVTSVLIGLTIAVPATARAVDPAKGYAGVCTGADARTGVTVVVDFQELDGNGGTAAPTITRCSPNANPGTARTGIKALQDAGIAVAGTAKWGLGFVCRLEGRPAATETLPLTTNPNYKEACVITPSPVAYWGYWYADGSGSAWTYSSQGALNRNVVPGGFEGWSFSLNKSASTNPPPRVTPSNPARTVQ